jgi:hypothetical protein
MKKLTGIYWEEKGKEYVLIVVHRVILSKNIKKIPPVIGKNLNLLILL